MKEKDLQTVQSIEGGKLRCVTANGESRNIPADAIGGGVEFVIAEMTPQGSNFFCNLSKDEIRQYLKEGKCVLARCVETNNNPTSFSAPMGYTAGNSYFTAYGRFYWNTVAPIDEYTYTERT